MNNYQLYRTNVKLGGQISWNLVLQSRGRDLSVKYFDVTPISPYVNYKYGQNTDCLRYTHEENVRNLYKEIKGQFYDACIDPRLLTLYPILDSDIQTHDSTLEYGCSRISYSRYNKQLQLFCPLWLEDFGPDSVLKFDIEILNEQGTLSLASKTLTLTEGEGYHKQFVEYFRNYVSYISKNGKIGEDVINIDIQNRFASVHGLDISSGNIVSRDISEITSNFLERERPMMETDYMIIDCFHTREMISKQIFNFNLVFDVADIMSSISSSMTKDDKFIICADVYVREGNGEWTKLEKCSFNNNYSSLKRGSDYPFDDQEHNFLSFNKTLKYLQDDKCIDLIRDNKLAPDICHWSLVNNNSYIFNLYPGFATHFPYFYKNSTNYWETDISRYPNVLNWCKNSEIDSVLKMMTEYVVNPNFTLFDITKEFVQDMKIDRAKNQGKSLLPESLSIYRLTNSTATDVYRALNNYNVKDYIVIYIVDGQINIKTSNDQENPFVSNIITPETPYVVLMKTKLVQHYILFGPKQYSYMMSYKWFVPVLNSVVIEDDPHFLETIKAVLNNVILPRFFYIQNTLDIKKEDGPWMDTDEISYVKNNNRSTLVIRYDGRIKPMFSTFDDLIWYRVIKTTAEEFEKNPAFDRKQTQGYLPNYPSVGFYNLEFVDKTNYDKINEYKWFENSVIFNLQSDISQKIYSKDISENYYSNDYLIDKVLSETYPVLYPVYSQYIRSLYNVEISYEYDDPAWDKVTDKFNYVYSIKLKLK